MHACLLEAPKRLWGCPPPRCLLTCVAGDVVFVAGQTHERLLAAQGHCRLGLVLGVAGGRRCGATAAAARAGRATASARSGQQTCL